MEKLKPTKKERLQDVIKGAVVLSITFGSTSLVLAYNSLQLTENSHIIELLAYYFMYATITCLSVAISTKIIVNKN